MDFEGKACGNCGKGKLHRIQDEVEKGIFVEAFKCSFCKNIAYSEYVMEKVEAMYRDKAEVRSLIKVGASLALSIPSSIVKKLGLKPKERVYVTTKGSKIIASVMP